jgi:colanic acid/amylovoran biosynthesis glycosyltransferase
MPRIAFVTTVYDGTGVGGSTFVRYLREAVDAGLLDMTFYSDDMLDPRKEYERPVRVPPFVGRLPGGFLVRAPYYREAVQRDHLHRAYDLIWHNNAITTLPVILRGPIVPLVGMINDDNNVDARSLAGALRLGGGSRQAVARRMWRVTERFAARRLTAVVANSDYLQSKLTGAYGLSPERVIRLYKAVALDQFPYSERPLSRDPLRVLFVKSDYIRGGLPDLLAALPRLAVPVQLSIAGPLASESGHIRALAQEHGYRGVLTLLGRLSRPAAAQALREHDVLCVPSRREALGVTFLEALASGTPAVGTQVGGIPEVLADGAAGWLARPGDPQDLARTLDLVIRDDYARMQRVRRGRQHVLRFSTDTMIEAVASIASRLSGAR